LFRSILKCDRLGNVNAGAILLSSKAQGGIELSTRLSPTIADIDDAEAVNRLDDLVDQIWQDLDGQVSREQVRQITAEVAAEFHKATITTFVPIFVRRQALRKLKAEMNS
jgi:phage FluMu protein gp41